MKKTILLFALTLSIITISSPISIATPTKANTLAQLEKEGVISPTLYEKIAQETHMLVLRAYIANLNATVAPLVKSGKVSKLQTQYYFIGYYDKLTTQQMNELKELINANPLKIAPIEKKYLQTLYKSKAISAQQLTSLLEILPINSDNYVIY